MTFKSCCFTNKGAISLVLCVSSERGNSVPHSFHSGTHLVSKSICVLSLLPFYVGDCFMLLFPLFLFPWLWLDQVLTYSFCFSPAQQRSSIALFYLRNAIKYGDPPILSFPKRTHIPLLLFENNMPTEVDGTEI